VLQAVDFALDVPNGLAQVLHGVAFLPCAPQVFDGIPDAEIMVLSNLDAFYPRRVCSVMRRVVDGVFGLLHPRTLAKPALLSTVCFSFKAKVPLFHEVTNAPLQALPAHHPANCDGGTISVSPPK
jgi:hypothetical protein